MLQDSASVVPTVVKTQKMLAKEAFAHN